MEILGHSIVLEPKSLFVGIMVLLLSLVYLQRRKGNLPPGPMQIPLLGSYFALQKDSRLYKVCAEMMRTYGKMATVNLGFGLEFVVLNSADLVHEAFIEKKEIIAGRDTHIWSFSLFTEGYKNIALGDYSPVWKIQRKVAFKAIRAYAMGEKLEELVKSSYSDVAALLKKEKGPVDFGEYIHLMLHNIISRMVFGKSYKVDDPEFVQWRMLMDTIVNDLFQSFLPGDFIPILRYVPIKSTVTCKKKAKEVLEILHKNLKDHKAKFNPEDTHDIMDHLLLAQKELEDEGDAETAKLLTDSHIVQTVLDVFFAGTETTSETLKWVLMYAAAYPSVQERMHNEIMDVLGNGHELHKSKSKLTYCDAVLHETMRLRPVTPVAVFHKVLQDTKLGGYDLPKGTLVVPNIWAIHHDPTNWDAPEEFRPERFLDKDGNITVDSKIWMPFSTGKRKCVGEVVARSDIMMILALFLREFKVSFPPDVQGDLDPDHKALDCHCKPHKMIIEKREG